MSATQTVVASLPPRIGNPEIIDVDALEDNPMEGVQYSGFQRSAGSSSRSLAASLADDGIAFMGFSRAPSANPHRRSHVSGGARPGPSTTTLSDDIIILESDDEGVSSSSNVSRRSPRRHSRFISPPPPPTQRGHTPAVPPLPPHLVSQRSLPVRHRHVHGVAHSTLPPVVRPEADPLPFETRLSSLPRLPPRRNANALASAPRSHHQPSMGFGGALIALNRQQALEEESRRERQAQSGGFNLPSFTDILRRFSGYGGASNTHEGAPGPAASRWQRFLPFMFDEPDQDANRHFSPFGEDDSWFHLPDLEIRKNVEKAVHWKPEYTHPYKAAPGFTFDFAPLESTASQPPCASSPNIIILDEDEAGPSSAGSSSSASATAIETTLVCARCLDPLVLAAPEGASEEERRKCRVWALRCGHMLDGKCISELFPPPTPPPATPAQAEQHVEGIVGKGKGKALVDSELVPSHEESHPAVIATVPLASSDRKGKRKAVEPLESETPKRPALADSASSSVSPENNSIRSRLRSHTRLAADVSPAAAEAETSIPLPPLPRRNQWHVHAQRRAGNRKGKGKARAKVEGRKPVVEAEHEWKCPVAGCGRVHYSVRVEGEWRNDEGRGGIPLFV